MTWIECAIALGSNLGDSQTILEASLQRLDHCKGIILKAVSPWYQTAPVGGPPQPDYLNGCALLTTALAPEQLLATLLQIAAVWTDTPGKKWGKNLGSGSDFLWRSRF